MPRGTVTLWPARQPQRLAVALHQRLALDDHPGLVAAGMVLEGQLAVAVDDDLLDLVAGPSLALLEHRELRPTGAPRGRGWRPPGARP